MYVINLDRRPERLAHFMKEFNAKGLRPNRVKAVDGQNLLYSTVKKISGPYAPKMRPGQYGCLLSHLAIYKDAYERGFSRIWILEDDTIIRLDMDVIPSLLSSLTTIDPDWDIFYTDTDSRSSDGGYHRPDGIPSRPDQPKLSAMFLSQRRMISENLWRIRSRWGCYSYILSRKGIEKVYNYFAHVYLFSPIDVDLHIIPTIRQYTAAEDIITNPRSTPFSDTEERS